MRSLLAGLPGGGLSNFRRLFCMVLAFLALSACARSAPAGFVEAPVPTADDSPAGDPLEGLDAARPGVYADLRGGRLYLPSYWTPGMEGGWPVTVVLHGYGNLSRSLSGMPFWEPLAEEYGVVLFFADRGTMGWDERRGSLDDILLQRILRGFRSKGWIKPGGIQLFGWSAGAIMAMGMAAANVKDSNGNPLFDRLAAASGGFGLIMEKELERDPALRRAFRVPVFASWGEEEPPDHGKAASTYLAERGWTVETLVHPGGHILPEETVREALSRNRR
jgi:predicted esterase